MLRITSRRVVNASHLRTAPSLVQTRCQSSLIPGQLSVSKIPAKKLSLPSAPRAARGRLQSNAVQKENIVSFYDSKVSEYANKPIPPITLMDLIKFGGPPLSPASLLNSARFAQQELPARLARRVKAFQNLPFIVGTNPYIKSIYKLYYDSFESIVNYPEVQHEKSVGEFAEMLRGLVDRHTDNIPILARGFQECARYMNPAQMTNFLDDMIHARIGIRLIAEQAISLHSPSTENPDHIGIINTHIRPADMVRMCWRQMQELCEVNYGVAPDIIINGQVDARFTYIPVHLEYMLCELLKNSCRASVEFARKIGKSDDEIPTIEVTISHGEEDSGIRIRDQGGGVSQKDLSRIFEYSYTTVEHEDEHASSGMGGASGSIFSGMSKMVMQTGLGGPIAGLGFGLPLARMYARYFGGELTLLSMEGYGCDVFLQLKNINESIGSLKI